MTTVNQPTLSVIIPVFREGAHLADALTAIHDELGTLNERCEVIVVDDGSPDDTWKQLMALRERFPQLKAVRLSRNFGKESALCAGLDLATGDAVIVMDGDLQHPPTLIPEMVRTWRESGAEVVEAVKLTRASEPWTNRFGARLFYSILNALSGFNLKNATDFKLLDRRVVEAWRRLNERSLFFRGMIAWLGFRRVQIPFHVAERVGGHSTWSLVRLARLAITAVTAFTSLPLHLVTATGLLFLLFAAILGIQTLYVKLSGGAVTGFTTVILLLLIIGSGVMMALGIIGEYVARIYEEVKGRPRYVIAETLDENRDE